MQIKYFLYARKSSEPEERQAMSIESQIAELTEFAHRENIKIVETFIESKSAKIPGRTEFNKMLERIYASKEPIGIISWHPDRLARNSVDGGQIIYLIDIKKICSLKFPTFWFEPTPQGLFMLQVAFGQSKYYSDNLSENVKRGIRQKLRRGEFGRKAPLGYLNNSKTRNIEPDLLKAKIVQKLFKEFAEGRYTLDSARHQLSFWGVMCKNGKPYTPYMVHRVLTNQTYLGLIEHVGEYHEGSFQPLISKAMFEAVQKKLNERGKPRTSKIAHNFVFKGVFKCAECGGQITAQFGKGNGGTYRYYRCTKKFGPCEQGYLREDLLVGQLKEQLNNIALSNIWAENMLKEIEIWAKEEQFNAKSFSQNLEIKFKAVELKMDNLVTAYLDGEVEKDNYLKKKEEILREKTDLNLKKIDFGKNGKNWVEPLRDWVKTAHHAGKLTSSDADFNDLKACLEKVGSNRLLRDKKIGFELLPPYQEIAIYKGFERSSPAEAGLLKTESDKSLLCWWIRRDEFEFHHCVLNFPNCPFF